jgi:hypothetical protein
MVEPVPIKDLECEYYKTVSTPDIAPTSPHRHRLYIFSPNSSATPAQMKEIIRKFEEEKRKR